MTAIPLALARQAVSNYLFKRPYCASFELTHNCNARCAHCHRGEVVHGEKLATPQELLARCLELRPIVAIMSGGEPLLRRDLPVIVSTLKKGAAPLRVFVNTNAGLLTKAKHDELKQAGVDEFLISFDYPDERHDAFRTIPGLFGRIRDLVASLPPSDRRGFVLTSVLQGQNYRLAVDMAKVAADWGVNINYSAYTWLRTQDRSLLVPPGEIEEFAAVVERLIAWKHAHHNVLTSDWVLRGMVRFYREGRIPGCRAGERSLVVNPDGTLSPCGLLVRGYRSHAELLREFTATNTCGDCYTSTRGNSERPARHIFLDHIGYLNRRADS